MKSAETKSLTFYQISEGKKVILARQENEHYRKGLKLGCALRFEQDMRRRKSVPVDELSTNLFRQKGSTFLIYQESILTNVTLFTDDSLKYRIFLLQILFLFKI